MFAKRPTKSTARRLSLLLIIFAVAVALATVGVLAQKSRKVSGGSTKATSGRNKTTSPFKNQNTAIGQTVGVPTLGERGIQRTTAEIMAAQQVTPRSKRPPLLKPEREIEGREDRPQNPDARPVASVPDFGLANSAGNPVIASADSPSPSAPQTVSTNFNTLTGPTENGAFPPDTMGAVGPTQFFVFVNGLIRTFTKAGAADGVINADPDVFFASVMTPVSPPVVINFTSDPNVRYDRLSGRWFISIIDVPCTNATCTTTAANRWMLAVSDAASAGVITGSTVWTFYQFQTDVANFCDYPSFGVDSQALYTGCNMFTGAGSFVGTNGYVIRKTSVLSGGPLVQTPFPNLAVGVGAGPFAPRGVDNYDPASNEGYFIGVDNATFGTLMIRRVSTPGGTPTISANISLAVSTTSSSIPIQHLGNTGGNNGRIDTLDDRLYAAHIRNGRLWTTHNIRVDATGVASTAAQSREAVRWYELNGIRSTDNGGVPVVVQSGTTFDNAATLAAARAFAIPSVTVSGQGHAAFGFTTAGSPFRIDAATNGRLVGDTLGTTQAVALYTASSTAYNPPADPGGPRRWGDYSFTSLDPLDDMTMWTIQEYCNATNTYGARVAKLLAPPPATPATAAPASLNNAQASVNVIITGTAVSGSGFYDPGANLAPPALPFTHISATVSGGVVVNSVTYTDPTHVTLNLNTTGASPGAKDVTITNPDGQSLTGVGILTVTAGATYTWNQTGTAPWTTATNWTPTRTTPAVDDILQFNNGATTTATGVPTETIGQLLISGNTNATLQPAAGVLTLTIGGGAGTDLSVANGSALNISGGATNTNTLKILVATGATGVIQGTMTFSTAQHQLDAADASGITFNSGSSFTYNPGAAAGNPFTAAGTANAVVFASGSTYVFQTGANPFGLGQPASKVVFQTGSLFNQTGTGTPSFSGRTYADYTLNNAAANITVTGGSAVSIDNLTITAGTLNFNMTANPGHSIKGNVSIAGTLNFNPASAGTVNFNGSSAQIISGAGTLTFAANQTININNAIGVNLNKDATLNGGLLLTLGDLRTGANTLTMPATATTGPATNATDVVGNVKRTGFVSGGPALAFGNPNNQIQINSGTAPTDINVNLLKASPTFFANAIRRTYTITVNGGSSLVGTVRFHYRNSDLNGNTENTLTAWRNDAGVWNDQGKSSNFDDGVGEDNWVQRDNVSTFSPWTLASGTPTAASANISGRIATANGSPIAGAVVRLSGGGSAFTTTDASGNYRFLNVDAGSFYTISPELANYHFNPESRSFSLVGNKTDAMFTAEADATATANAIDSSEYFVRQQYLDFLGREPERGGLAYWSDQLNQCNGNADCLRGRRIDVSAAFFMSDEFKDTGSFVYRLYRGALGRQLRYDEFAADRAQVVGGPNLESSKAAFANAFVQRAEFAAKYQGNLDAASFVDALLRTMIDSGVDLVSARSTLVSRYNAGSNLAESRALVVRDLIDNATFTSAVYNESFVAMQYYGYLRRNPDRQGFDFWLGVMSATANHRGMVCSFLTSTEYQRRFSSVVTHSNTECGR